jgi:2-oxo-4-hydroxy-4-carboxy--5-ureidoimidazoline (OHCU) decarboxylase
MAMTSWFRAAQAMHQYGGSFAKALAKAFYVADAQNQAKLVDAFPALFAKYALVAANQDADAKHQESQA